MSDLTPGETVYDRLRAHYPRTGNGFRPPPTDPSIVGFEKRVTIGEAPLFITTCSGRDPGAFPEEVDLRGYWYGTSKRPDVHVREIISVDNMGTAYWRFNDTYGYRIGEPADGDQAGDIKWEFGGAVMRAISETNPINEYAVYSSLWVLLPFEDNTGARITPPFRGAGVLDGGPVMTITVGGVDTPIDMLFLPKGVRPGDVLEVGDIVAFSGHVGPPLGSHVSVTITSPSNVVRAASWHANKIGWLYDPGFDFAADETGRWTVDVAVLYDRPYQPTGFLPTANNTGTVLGTTGRYSFYVVCLDSPRLTIETPQPGIIVWPQGVIESIPIRGVAPLGTTAVHYTIHDKGTVMCQGTVVPDGSGVFTVTYDALALHADFPYVSLTAHEGRWEGLADEVAISMLAEGGSEPRSNTVTLIGEEVFVWNDAGADDQRVYLPLVQKAFSPSMTSIFSDDFDGGGLSGWTSNNGVWTNPGTHLRGEDSLRNAWNIRSSTGSDVVYEGTVTLLNGNAVGLVLRSSATGENSYDTILDAQDGAFKISKRAPYQVLASHPMTVQRNQPYRIKVVDNGSTIEAYLDGVKRLTVVDNTYTSGNLGVMLFLATATYDDLQAWEMPEAPGPRVFCLLGKGLTGYSCFFASRRCSALVTLSIERLFADIFFITAKISVCDTGWPTRV